MGILPQYISGPLKACFALLCFIQCSYYIEGHKKWDHQNELNGFAKNPCELEERKSDEMPRKIDSEIEIPDSNMFFQLKKREKVEEKQNFKMPNGPLQKIIGSSDFKAALSDQHEMTPKIKIISTSSIIKLSFIVLMGIGGSYINVSPRNAPKDIYLEIFKRNMLLLATSLIGPILIVLTIHDGSKVDADTLISVFFSSFTWGYLLVCGMEIALTTIYRLVVLKYMEPDAFALCPDVPSIYLPWVLKENGYNVKPLTSFVSDFFVFCLFAPIVEEVIKVFIARTSKKIPKIKRNSKRNVEIVPSHVHSYVELIIAAAVGLKVADNGRRILMYNKSFHSQKFLFALLRGFYPLHEICAAISAMKLARKEVLGHKIGTFGIFVPAFLLHALSNFRGGKPMFKWKSDSPWLELQLGRWNFPESITLIGFIQKFSLTLVWCFLSLGILSYTIRNYWQLSQKQ
mmetsp:Transcript_2853/g.3986  ORF Transcript_2853/g.3986 Transcript_2853/m.3986 type:complete len:458 (+) Transcript_2853:82-1455(+)